MPVILTPRQRTKIREGLREAVAGKSASERAAVEKLIGNRRMFNAFIRSAGEAHAETKGGPVTDFIDFILSRADQLIAFVKAIMALFGALLILCALSAPADASPRVECSNGQCRLVPSVEIAGNCANGQCRVSVRPQRRGWIRFLFGR